jgi:phosphoribosylanthranilate isomerase
MLTQVYEITSAEEAAAIARIGVDHIGVLVGDGSFPREQSPARAASVAAAIGGNARFSALFLSLDVAYIARSARELRPSILHLGCAPELLGPDGVLALKRQFPGLPVMRSVPVVDATSVAIACAYEGIADFLLLDSYRANDRQIGALGIPHDWGISRRIVETVRVPVILAGGLGPDNVAQAIRAVRPAGVDSKTRTDKSDTHRKDLEKVRLFHEAAKAATP